MQGQSYKQEISVQKSQELVQELVSVSLYCITFLRNIFEDENYLDSKCYADDAKQHSVTDKNYIRTQKLIKGVSQQGDVFVNCVETGIKATIELEYLKAIQFSIHLSESSPQNIVESYVFVIDYLNQKVSILLNNLHELTVDTAEVMKQIQSLIKRLIVLTQSLDPLPDEKYISIRLMFNDKCPSDYQPPYFQDCTNSDPAVIQVEKKADNDDSRFEIGFVNTGKNKVKLNVLCAPSDTSVPTTTLDPFDIVDGIGTDVEDLPSCSLHLDDFFETEEVVPHTQVIPKPRIQEIEIQSCKKCKAKINLIEHGDHTNIKNRKAICMRCMFPEMDPDMLVLIKVRLLWNHLLNNDFGTFGTLLNAMDVKINEEELIAKVFSRLFCDHALVITNRGIFSSAHGDYSRGSGEFTPLVSGMIDNSGTELEIGRQYFIMFVPKLKGSFNFMSYDNSVDKIYFPNFMVARVDMYRKNLKKFKALKQPSLLEPVKSNSAGLLVSNISYPGRDQFSDAAETTNSLADLSFEDSLVFLSQQKDQFAIPTTRKPDHQLQTLELKKRKISINKI